MSNANWYNVDNVSKVFLASYNKRDTRCIRVTCTLKEMIEPELLQEALTQTVEAMPQYQVRIRRGFFWHYLDPTDAMPVVSEEDGRLYPLLYGPNHKGLLHYKVSYYRCRITLEIFHVLCDGTGALEFLNALVGHYLKLKYPAALTAYTPTSAAPLYERTRDDYAQFFDRENTSHSVAPKKRRKAYRIQGRLLPYDQLQHFELHMEAAKVVAAAKACGCSVTAYFTALFMLAIQRDMPTAKRKRPVAISLPVNLRRFYGSETSRNFFNNISLTHTFDKPISLPELAALMDKKLKELTSEEAVRFRMNEFVKIERPIYTRMTPLLIKQHVVRQFTAVEAKQVSAVISNLGLIRPDEAILPYVDYYSIGCSAPNLFSTICSFGSDLCMTISYPFVNTGVLKAFVDLLQRENIPVKLDATEVITR
ncbi:MAG: hypothetical protein Q4B73_07270 [Lachnospiraceae bacterium]|nr:hypothetical protein [Lachnospiraceae bacterium]